MTELSVDRRELEGIVGAPSFAAWCRHFRLQETEGGEGQTGGRSTHQLLHKARGLPAGLQLEGSRNTDNRAIGASQDQPDQESADSRNRSGIPNSAARSPAARD